MAVADIPERRREYTRKEIRALIVAKAVKYGIEPGYLNALVEIESDYDPYAVSEDGARGLAQLKKDAAEQPNVGKPGDYDKLFDPEFNLERAAQYIRWQAERPGIDPQNPLIMASAYNAGAGAVDEHGGVPPYRETIDYTRRLRARHKGGVFIQPKRQRQLAKQVAPELEELELSDALGEISPVPEYIAPTHTEEVDVLAEAMPIEAAPLQEQQVQLAEIPLAPDVPPQIAAQPVPMASPMATFEDTVNVTAQAPQIAPEPIGVPMLPTMEETIGVQAAAPHIDRIPVDAGSPMMAQLPLERQPIQGALPASPTMPPQIAAVPDAGQSTGSFFPGLRELKQEEAAADTFFPGLAEARAQTPDVSGEVVSGEPTFFPGIHELIAAQQPAPPPPGPEELPWEHRQIAELEQPPLEGMPGPDTLLTRGVEALGKGVMGQGLETLGGGMGNTGAMLLRQLGAETPAQMLEILSNNPDVARALIAPGSSEVIGEEPFGLREDAGKVEEWIRDLGGALPTTGAIAFGGLLSGPAAPLTMGALGGSVAGGHSYAQAREDGMSHEDAATAWALGATGGAILETIGGAKLLKAVPKNVRGAIMERLEKALTEGGTELVQSVWENIVPVITKGEGEKVPFPEFVKMLKQGAYEFTIGAAIGAGAPGGGRAQEEAVAEEQPAQEEAPKEEPAHRDEPAAAVPTEISTEPLPEGTPIEELTDEDAAQLMRSQGSTEAQIDDYLDSRPLVSTKKEAAPKAQEEPQREDVPEHIRRQEMQVAEWAEEMPPKPSDYDERMAPPTVIPEEYREAATDTEPTEAEAEPQPARPELPARITLSRIFVDNRADRGLTTGEEVERTKHAVTVRIRTPESWNEIFKDAKAISDAGAGPQHIHSNTMMAGRTTMARMNYIAKHGADPEPQTRDLDTVLTELEATLEPGKRNAMRGFGKEKVALVREAKALGATDPLGDIMDRQNQRARDDIAEAAEPEPAATVELGRSRGQYTLTDVDELFPNEQEARDYAQQNDLEIVEPEARPHRPALDESPEAVAARQAEATAAGEAAQAKRPTALGATFTAPKKLAPGEQVPTTAKLRKNARRQISERYHAGELTLAQARAEAQPFTADKARLDRWVKGLGAEPQLPVTTEVGDVELVDRVDLETTNFRQLTGDEAVALPKGAEVFTIDEDGNAERGMVSAKPKRIKGKVDVRVRRGEGRVGGVEDIKHDYVQLTDTDGKVPVYVRTKQPPITPEREQAGADRRQLRDFRKRGWTEEDIEEYMDEVRAEREGKKAAEDETADASDASFDFGSLLPSDSNVAGLTSDNPIPLWEAGKQLAVKGKQLKAKLEHLYTRWISKGGYAGDSAHEAVSLGEARREAVTQQIREAEHDYDIELRKWTNTGRVSARFGKGKSAQERANQTADEILKGDESAREGVPEDMLKVLDRMRAAIDRLSTELLQSGIIEPGSDLEYTIAENRGVYLRRSYRAFTDPEYTWEYVRDNHPEKISAAKAWVRAQLEEGPSLYDETDVDNFVRDYFKEDTYGLQAAATSLSQTSEAVTKKDLNPLRARKNVPAVIRDMLGEHRSAMTNYMHSVRGITQILNAHRTMTEIRRVGLEQGWLKDRKQGDYRVQIADPRIKNADANTPLRGLYTTREIAEDYSMLVQDGQDIADGWRWYQALQSRAKFTKVVLSIPTNVRNVVGNAFFRMGNGNWKVWGKGKQSLGAVIKAKLLAGGTKEQRRLNRRALELGVTSSGVRASDLQRGIEDALKPPTGRGKTGRQLVRKAEQVATSIYQAEDDVPKMMEWLTEIENYRKVHPDMSQQQLEEHAARFVRGSMPNYGNINRRLRSRMRRIPLGNFPAFAMESFRSRYFVTRTALAERQEGIKSGNKAQVRLAERRLASNALVVGGLSGGVSLASALAFGYGEDDQEAIEQFTAPWSKYSDKVWLPRDKNGNARFLDLGYIDPMSPIRKPFNAFMQNLYDPRTKTKGDYKRALIDSTLELVAPYTDTAFAAKTIVEVLYNQKIDGDILDQWLGEETKRSYKLVNKHDPEFMSQLFGHIYDELWQPGTQRAYTRVREAIQGRERGGTINPVMNELLSFVGFRTTTVDPAVGLPFRARSISNTISEAQSVHSRELNKRGTLDKKRIASTQIAAQEGTVAAYADLYKSIKGARHYGMTDDEIYEGLRDGGISGTAAGMLLDGTIPLYFPRRNPENAPELTDQLIDRLQDEYGSDELTVERP